VTATIPAFIPAFAFHEADDGTITWGASWKPGLYADPEPVVVEYVQTESGLWVPCQAWVRNSKGSIDMHDCDWIESRQKLCHHESGGGTPYVNRRLTPERLLGRIWIADGTVVTSDGWEGPKLVLSDDDLLALGIRRVHGPKPAPFNDAHECDVLWCDVCNENIPDADGEFVSFCGFCSEKHHIHEGGMIAVFDEDEAGSDESGIYRIKRWPFYWSNLWNGALYADAIERVANLPIDVSMDGDAVVSLCQDCAAEIMADRGLPILASEWSEDPDAMSDDRREALLDAVRSRVDDWVAGYPEDRAARVHEWFLSKMAARFWLPRHEMRMLCEEAGYQA
jgi:hypothetical protein